MNEVRRLPRIGVIGDMGWGLAGPYLQGIPQRIQQQLNTPDAPFIGMHMADRVMIRDWIEANNRKAISDYLLEAALDFRRNDHVNVLAIASDTLHVVADEIAAAIDIPLIHLGECAAKLAWRDSTNDRIGFIGSKLSMQEDFLLKHFRGQGLEVFTPPSEAMNEIDDVIHNEFYRGKFTDESCEFICRQAVALITRYKVGGIVLGCTGLVRALSRQKWSNFCLHRDSEYEDFQFFDAMQYHIDAIVAFCCS